MAEDTGNNEQHSQGYQFSTKMKYNTNQKQKQAHAWKNEFLFKRMLFHNIINLSTCKLNKDEMSLLP